MVLTNFFAKNISTVSRLGYLRNLSSSAKLLSTEDRNSHYDIIIAGGGMVGIAMAAALGHNPVFNGKKILMLESGPQVVIDKIPEKYSSRVCALSNSTKSFLSSFGAWDNILRMQNVNYMRVWDSCSDVGITFDCDKLPPKSTELAYIAENNLISSAILKQLLNSGVEVRFNSKVKSCDMNKNSEHPPSIQLDSGETLSSELLIGADGMNSMLRKSSSMSSVGWSYDQRAVVSIVKFSGDFQNHTAWQRFLPTGPVALLPLSNEHSCLIWSTTTDHANELLDMDPKSFVNAVNSAFTSDFHVNGSIAEVGRTIENLLLNVGLGESCPKQYPPRVIDIEDDSKKSFPLGLVHSTNYIGPRIALIGDAAHRIHPLAGQGVNLGFGDVSCLLEVLEETVLLGGDIGCMKNLKKYETERQRRVVPMMAAIDLLGRLYGNKIQPFVMLRSIGCQVANSVPFIKKTMMQFAAN